MQSQTCTGLGATDNAPPYPGYPPRDAELAAIRRRADEGDRRQHEDDRAEAHVERQRDEAGL